jgi:uncharacterized membrane protein
LHLPIFWLAAALLGAAAIWLRASGTLREPLWLDEAYSAYAAGKGWAFLWQIVPRYETHPPFYYSLLRLWSLGIGDSLPGLRALGIICGIATLPVIAIAARETSRSLGWATPRALILILTAFALAVLSPSLVEMSREVRPYPVLILVYATGIAAILRLGRRMAEGGPLTSAPFALYLAALALILWLHNLGPLLGFALGLALLAMVVRRSLGRADWLWLVGGHLLVLLVYLPALLIMFDQAPTWISSTWLKFSFSQLWLRLAMLYAVPGAPEALAALVLALSGCVALGRTAEGRRIGLALLLTALLPVILSVTISALVAPVFIVRTMTPVAIPAVLLMAAGAAGLAGHWRWPALGALLLLLVQMSAIDLRARRGPPMQDWYGAVRWLAARHRPGDIILAYPNEGALPFDRAARDLKLDLPTRPIPTAVPTLVAPGGWHPTGSRGVVSLPRDQLRAVAARTKDRPTVWLLRLGPWAYDKGDVLLQELERGRTRIGDWRSGPIDIIGLRLDNR